MELFFIDSSYLTMLYREYGKSIDWNALKGLGIDLHVFVRDQAGKSKFVKEVKRYAHVNAPNYYVGESLLLALHTTTVVERSTVNLLVSDLRLMRLSQDFLWAHDTIKTYTHLEGRDLEDLKMSAPKNVFVYNIAAIDNLFTTRK